MNDQEGKEDSQQSTEVLPISDEHSHSAMQIIRPPSPEFTYTPNGTIVALSPVKATSMGRAMEVVSRLPGVRGGDEKWVDTAHYLLTSEAARELVITKRVTPEAKAKWLDAEVKKLKK